MISIESISFELPENWSLVESEQYEKLWHNDDTKASLTLHFFDKEPDLPARLSELDAIRNAYRQEAASAGGGIISVELLEIQSLTVLETVFKLPQEPQGMSYLGALTFPFASCSFVISIRCPESGTTGLRESAVLAEFLQDPRAEIDVESGQISNWAFDPYEPSFSGPCLANRADSESFDRQFPRHPLTIVRALLKELGSKIQINDELLAEKPFRG